MPQHDPRLWWFVLGLLPVYWFAPRGARPWVLAAANTLFLAWVEPYLLLLVGMFTALLSLRASTAAVGAVALLAGARLLQGGVPDAVVPVGLAFLVLKAWSAAVDGVGEAKAITIFNWLAFFPAVTVGPVQRLEEFGANEARQRWDEGWMDEAVFRVLLGYTKVLFFGVALLEQVAVIELLRLGVHEVPREAFLRMARTLVLFSGYSDIAIGIGLAFGQRLPENFQWPLLQPDLGAFWRSWNASVSEWCRRYVFVPVLARTRSPSAAAFVSFGVLGLWHETSWAYAAWGLFHGAGVAVWQAWRRSGQSLPNWLSVPLTVAFVYTAYLVTEWIRFAVR